MYMHTLARFCESQRRFSLLLSLKYITYSFFSLSVSPRSPPPPLPQAQGHPCPSLLLPCLPSACPPSAPAVCCVCRGCRVCPVVSPSVSPSPWLVPCVCLLCVRLEALPAAFCVSCCCRHSSAVRRKTVWQCGQMHRVYVPGLVSSCLCAAVVRSVACSVACPAACRVSSGGSNSRYASMSRAAAMRCSVWSVMLLLSMAV